MSRTWFITGIGSGFGREMASQLLARGERVAGTTRSADGLHDLTARYGSALWTAILDVTDAEAVKRVVQRAFDELGVIDVIVNNAGYGLFGALEGLSEEQIRKQIETNLLGPIYVTQAAVPHLRTQGGGRILAISTYGGQATHPGASLYHASKWGLEGFMDSIAQELAAFNIGVTIVEPGGARTGFRAAAGQNLGADLEAYKGTPAGMVHAFLKDTTRQPVGDPVKMVHSMIGSVSQSPAPRRLVLGSDAYGAISKALTERLAEVEAQKSSAGCTDAD